jgi:tetratricopeptide (TPR) repeat protein
MDRNLTIQCYDHAVLRDRSQHPTASSEREPDGSYTRKEVCRLLKIDARQLKSWERNQLMPEREEYTFSDLLALKELARLHNENLRPVAMRNAMQAARKCLGDLPDALGSIRVYKEGRRVRLQIGKQRMEACSGQLLFDFAENEIKKILQLPGVQKNTADVAARIRNKLESDRWFERGLELEQTGAPYEEIISAYKKAAELDSTSAGALVNLGTVFFNGHAWSEAELHYKKALEIDPNYPLAHFNLGNLYDEWGDTPSAEYHYGEAIKLNPKYADAHYNVALLYQNQNDVMKAVRHWRAYLKLDPVSAWSHIARRELGKLESMTVVKGNRSSSKLAIFGEKI